MELNEDAQNTNQFHGGKKDHLPKKEEEEEGSGIRPCPRKKPLLHNS